MRPFNYGAAYATAAVSFVELTNVVASAAPFHCNCAPCAKPVPVALSVKPAPPATADAGLNVVSVGGAEIVNLTAADVTVPIATPTFAVPAVAIRSGVTYAVS